MQEIKPVIMFKGEFKKRKLRKHMHSLEVLGIQVFDARKKMKIYSIESILTCVILSIVTIMENWNLYSPRRKSFDIDNFQNHWKSFSANGVSDQGADPKVFLNEYFWKSVRLPVEILMIEIKHLVKEESFSKLENHKHYNYSWELLGHQSFDARVRMQKSWNESYHKKVMFSIESLTDEIKHINYHKSILKKKDKNK